MQAPGGQTLNDRLLAARHSLAGQGLAKAVCKATTEEIIGPKKKHLDYLLQCTNEPNVSIPTLANLLIERTLNPNWVVVYKSLITIHHLMCYGNERFTQYLASSNSNFQLANFLDKTGVQGLDKLQGAIAHAVYMDQGVKQNFEKMRAIGGASSGPIRGYDMSPFIRRYAKYLSEKSGAYRGTAMDFCKVKRGKDGGALRNMTGDKLLKTMPMLQSQVDALLEFDCTATDLNNGVINACFMLLFRDLIRLFACYNDGIINLLEKYFEMQKKQARDALDLYKKFLIRMDRVAEFLKVAEKFGIDKAEIPDLARSVGIEKGDIPDLAKAPSSLLEALEGHLANLEGRKPGSGGTTPTSGGHSAFGSAASNGGNIDERTAKQLMEEEAAAMEKFRSTAGASNPFAAAPAGGGAEETPNILDLFGVEAPPAGSSAPAPAPAAAAAASDDLLQLSGNPFANMLNNAGGSNSSFAPQPTSSPMFAAPAASAGLGLQTQSQSSVFASENNFVSDNSFANVFGQAAPAVISPMSSSGPGLTSGGKLVTGDLDSSLANLASNLNFGPGGNRQFGATPARGPPMANTTPGGFNPFPQQQQMGQMDNFASPAGPALSSTLSPNPPALPTMSLTSTPSFPASASSSMLSNQATPGPPAQTSPYMPSSLSMNGMDLFSNQATSSSKSPFSDSFGGLNGNSSASGGQFLNNNGFPPMKPLTSPINNGSVTDQFGLL